MPANTFSHTEWISQFRVASKNKAGYRELRVEIFQQTVQVVNDGKYECEGKVVELDSSKTTTETYFYNKPLPLNPANNDYTTNFGVIEADCIEVSQLLNKAGYNVCMLNMANRQNPGGYVIGGSGAQDENIFRRSNLFQSLYQFVDYAKEYGVERNPDNSYPLDRNSGGIYSRSVLIFRGSEKNGYCFLKKPFEISIVTVPAINNPQLDSVDGILYITERLVEPTKDKIRTILRICGEHKHDCLVLGAFGCGAFRTPPHHMAQLFREVFTESEFVNQFKLVVFAILSDHNSWKAHIPNGNALPFLKEVNIGIIEKS